MFGWGVRAYFLTRIFGWGAGKDPVAGPEDLKMIHGGKVLDNTKTFEGQMPAL